MADYKLYFLDLQEHIRGVLDIAADSDDEAVAEAVKQAESRPFELWQRARRVRWNERSPD